MHIVWQQGSAGGRNIAVYDLLTGTTTILSSPGDEIFPLVSGTTLAWIQMVDADGEVFVDPGPIGNQLTGNPLVESEFSIDGENLVWAQGDDLHQTSGTADDSHDIAVWNGALQGLYILTGPSTDDIHPSIAGDTVVWQAGPDGSGDIWYGDTLGTANLLFDGTDERNPQTDGTRVIWQHFDGLDFDLYIVDLASPNSTIPFTNDTLDDVTPQIDGDNIVWVKKVTPGDSEIWFSWNGGAAGAAAEVAGQRPRRRRTASRRRSLRLRELPQPRSAGRAVRRRDRARAPRDARRRRRARGARLPRVAIGASRAVAGADSAPPLRGEGRGPMAS